MQKVGPIDVYDFLKKSAGFTAFLTTRRLTNDEKECHYKLAASVLRMIRPGVVLKKCIQVHDIQVAEVQAKDSAEPVCDAICTIDRNVALAVSVADCCPVFICDPSTGAMGLAHSGKKGTLLNICGALVAALRVKFGSHTRNLFAQIGACIRPPLYEVDLAGVIRKQLIEAGIPENHINDCGVNTGAEVERYYSYRVEKGNTGRMVAVIFR